MMIDQVWGFWWSRLELWDFVKAIHFFRPYNFWYLIYLNCSRLIWNEIKDMDEYLWQFAL